MLKIQAWRRNIENFRKYVTPPHPVILNALIKIPVWKTHYYIKIASLKDLTLSKPKRMPPPPHNQCCIQTSEGKFALSGVCVGGGRGFAILAIYKSKIFRDGQFDALGGGGHVHLGHRLNSPLLSMPSILRAKFSHPGTWFYNFFIVF